MIESIKEELEEEVSKCISCGFCEAVCPTLPSSGFNLWKGARGRVIMGSTLLESRNAGKDFSGLKDSFYSCLDCHACLYVCPAGVNAGKVSQLSRELMVSEKRKDIDPAARMIASVTMKKMNPLGLMKRTAGWAEGLDFDQDSETLLYTGNMYQITPYAQHLNARKKSAGKRVSDFVSSAISKFPSLSFLLTIGIEKKISSDYDESLRKIVLLLKRTGISFSYLGVDEPYPGTFLHDLGFIEEFREYANRVTGIFRDHGAKKIVTVDPHTYELLKYVYPEYVENFDFEVSYYLDEIRNMNFEHTEEKVVYHEPCHFVLRDFNYREPDFLLQRTSDVTKPTRSGRRNECCGGPNELLFPELAGKTSERRHDDLVKTGADTIITSCPICYSNLSKGNKIRDIADFLLDKVQ